MDTRKGAALLLLLLLASSALAQDAFTEWALKDMQWRIESIVKLLLCAIWAITAAALTIVVIISGIRYLTSQDADEKDKAKKNIKQGFVGLMIIVAACPFVNYLVHGTDVAEFRCDCIPLPPPTTTTTTTTTIPIGAPGTRPTTTTTTTTTTVTTMPKSGGGRFLLVGECTFVYGPCASGDLDGVIFNIDGTIYRDVFPIDTGLVNPLTGYDPVALGVGNNRFFVAYGANAVVLDWEGNTVKAKFTTEADYVPVKVIQTNGKFYVLLSPVDGGGCMIKVYDLDGNLLNSYKIDIDSIFSFSFWVWGDMALGGDKLFIVWSDKPPTIMTTSDLPEINGIIYDLSGKKVKDRFLIDNSYGNVEVEAGEKYFLVATAIKIFLYDLDGKFMQQKDTEMTYLDDLTYGDGKFLAAQGNLVIFYNEDGDSVGKGMLGGHGDCPTQLAYGNKMFVGVVAIHSTGDGIGASFLDSNGNHLIDIMPLEMPESPGWAAYDW